MKIYFEKYQEDDFSHKKRNQWYSYGLQSFKSFLYFLDFPKDVDLEFLGDFMTYQVFYQGDTLVKEGNPVDQAFFIIQGVVKITGQKSEKYEVCGILPSGNLVSSTVDFYKGTGSPYTLTACGKVRCLVLKRTDLDVILKRVREEDLKDVFNAFNVKTMEYLKWINQNMRLVPFERIKALYEVGPELFASVTDSDLAFFLGMARGTFSRLKSEVFRQM